MPPNPLGAQAEVFVVGGGGKHKKKQPKGPRMVEKAPDNENNYVAKSSGKSRGRAGAWAPPPRNA